MNYSRSSYLLLVLHVPEPCFLLLGSQLPSSFRFLTTACQALHESADFGTSTWEKELGRKIHPSSFPDNLWASGLDKEESLCQLLPVHSGLVPTINHLSAKGPKSPLPAENGEMLSWESSWSSLTNLHFHLPLPSPQLAASTVPHLRPCTRAQALKNTAWKWSERATAGACDFSSGW